MKAPDKIYLAFDHGFVAQSSSSKEDANGNNIFLSKYKPIEYICKDALLKWIEETRAIPHDGAMWRDKAFQEVVNHLNTM